MICQISRYIDFDILFIITVTTQALVYNMRDRDTIKHDDDNRMINIEGMA